MNNLSDIRRHFDNSRRQAAADYEKHRRPWRFFSEHCRATDQMLAALWDTLFSGSRLTLLACGGYGRGEVYPYSDLDLTIAAADALTEAEQQQIGRFVQILWDWQLTPAVKSGSVAELCAAALTELTADTALLESRHLAGCLKTAQTLQQRMYLQRDTAAFTDGKIAEMQARRAKQPGIVLEPNIKNCAGGLRDIHTVIWLAKVQGIAADFRELVRRRLLTREEAELLMQSYQTLARTRIALHLAAQREEDRLVFDFQAAAAAKCGIAFAHAQEGGEKLMHRVYRALKNVMQLADILIPLLQQRVYGELPRILAPIDADYFQIGNKIAAHDLRLFEKQPEHIFIIAEQLQNRRDLTGIAPKTLRAWRAAVQQIDGGFYQNPANRTRFLGFFQAGSGLTHILRLFNLYGLLSRYLPEWHKIVGLLQHDLYHIYPVDDHILTVLRNMRRLAMESHSHELPFASELMQAFDAPYLLYLAALFHDIAKGRGGRHEIQGIADARRFAADHALPDDDADLLAWLVEHHLLMSQTAQKEDIQDPETVRRFCEKVGSLRRLSALYLLTVADIRGTNPNIWNSWKAQLLEQLYRAAERCLAGHSGSRESIAGNRRRQAEAALVQAGFDAKSIRRLWQALGQAYFVRHDLHEILWHTGLIAAAPDMPCSQARTLPEINALEAMIFMPNAPRLFTRLCRIFSRHGLNIAAARAFVSEHGFILDTFTLHAPPHSTKADLHRIQAALQRDLAAACAGSFPERPSLRQHSRRARLLPIAAHIDIYADESGLNRYVLDIVATNRPLLLADITEVLAAHGISLLHARISTLADRAEDSFLIDAPALSQARNEQALRSSLLAVLNQS